MRKHKYTTETFIEKAREIHGDKYDYSKVEYVDIKTKVCIICPEHGEFWQSPELHLNRGNDCPVCGRLKNVKWTKEACYEEAKKYKTRTDFYKGNNSAYNSAKQHNWIDDYYWIEHAKSPYTENIDNVYAFFFVEKNSVYIGRTINLKEREKSHHKNEKSSVYKFAKENNIEIPKITILKKDLSLEDGLLKEDFYITKYKNEGWNILNKAKTGLKSGSIGAICEHITYNKCYNIAKKCKTTKEFRINYKKYYQKAKKSGWLCDFDWLDRRVKPCGYWTYDKCYNEAKKYKTRTEFAIKSDYAYKLSCDNGWIDNYEWFITKRKPMGYWNNYDHCYEEAKKYNTKYEFEKSAVAAYQWSRKNGWLSHYSWFERNSKISGYWNNYENCYNEAKKYKSRKEFQCKCSGAYHSARKNGWLDDYTWFEKKYMPNGYWNDYNVCYEAQMECRNVQEFSRKYSSAYRYSRINGWLNMFFPKK